MRSSLSRPRRLAHHIRRGVQRPAAHVARGRGTSNARRLLHRRETYVGRSCSGMTRNFVRSMGVRAVSHRHVACSRLRSSSSGQKRPPSGRQLSTIERSRPLNSNTMSRLACWWSLRQGDTRSSAMRVRIGHILPPPVGRVDPIDCARTLSLVLAQGDVPRRIPALDEEFLDLIGASGDEPPPLHDVTSNERRVE